MLVAPDPPLRPTAVLTEHGRRFVTERHLATLSTIGPRGVLHVVAVGFTYVDGVVRIITSGASQKVRNVERDHRATVAQVSGPEWLSIAGRAVVERDPESVGLAVRLYAERYRQPRVNPTRVVIRIDPERVLGSAGVWAPAPKG
ncbi:pyridoxamine 5'-phosphate oxidase family protein [Agromyces sp. NPDC056523]|uniref:pyridoxamine 5'-phosphate oxidase family protein n=1 Tax=Agromyces sp. NPDC056523 TaxID=3345850 RepID=UPI00367180B8